MGARKPNGVKLERLAALREAAFLSQQELADRAGVARSTVARIELGEEARRATARKLAEVLGVAPAELMAPAVREHPAP